MVLKWGIVAAGKISSDFVACLRSLPEDHKVVAVGARDLDRAKKFAETHSIPQAYQGYEKLTQDPNVEIAYIGSLHTHHFEHASLLLQHGKHVLCEKPLCITQKQTKGLIALAKEKNVFFMEDPNGNMLPRDAFLNYPWSLNQSFLYIYPGNMEPFPAYHKVREVLASGQLGQVKFVSANFGRNLLDYAARFSSKDDAGGSVMEIGIYPIQLASLVYGGQQPTSISANGFLIDSGVDGTASVVLKYPNNAMAVLGSSISCNLPNEGYIVGTERNLKICEPVWCPTRVEISEAGKVVEVHEYPLPDIKWKFNYPDQQGMQYMAAAVGDYIKQGVKESPLMTHNDSILFSGITDKARHDLGYYFDDEEK